MKGNKTGQLNKLRGSAVPLSKRASSIVPGKKVKYRGKLIDITDRYKIGDSEFVEYSNPTLKTKGTLSLKMLLGNM